MGSCFGKPEDDELDVPSSGSALGRGSDRVNGRSVHSVLIRHRNDDVYKKYTTIEVLGQGSMGCVSKVQVKEGQEGGSAFNPVQKKKSRSKLTAAEGLSERRIVKVDYALKQIQLDKVSFAFIEELHNEIDILKGMVRILNRKTGRSSWTINTIDLPLFCILQDHPNIVKAHEVFNHKKQIYIILELCDGGDLYTRLPYSEMEAAYISGKLLSAIKYMHDHGIVHRDCE
jgi:serine/threonine protein kinase